MKRRALYGAPTETMLDELSGMGIRMREVAGIILADDGAIPRSVASIGDKRSVLTKRLKQARPGSLGRKDFDEFEVSVPKLLKLLIEGTRSAPGEGEHDVPHSRDARAVTQLVGCLAGPAALAMERALQNYSLGDDIYDNVLDAIMAAPFQVERRRLELLLMLFVATGSLSDARQAAEITDAYCRRRNRMSLFEEVPAGKPESELPGSDDAMCLLRMTGTASVGFRHTVPPTEEGCVIGVMPGDGRPAITDVDPSVSAEHLRVFRRGGAWWAEGMYSRNGTKLVSGRTGDVSVIEPPEENQGDGYEPKPVRLLPGDKLVLGSTVFRFLRFRRGE